jgi:thiol-disulfide isomerase/thioredoxin
MINSSSFSSNFNYLSNNNELLKIALSSIILIIVIVIIYNIRSCNNRKENKETIIFYVADWCPHCKKLKPFIKKCKEQDIVIIEIVSANNMSNEEKQKINGFPTAIRVSDNKMVVGEVEIKKLVNKTFAKWKVNNFDTEEQYNNTLTYYEADWCVHCDIIKKYILYLQSIEKQTKIKVNIVNFNDMNDNEKILINGFPSMMRKSDNVISSGKIDIENLVNNTLPSQFLSQVHSHAQAAQVSQEAHQAHQAQQAQETHQKQQAQSAQPSQEAQVVQKEFITNNDTIQFYIAEWCGHSQKLVPYIDEYKKQNVVNVEVIYDKDIPSELNITGYPTAIRKSDNKRAVGGPEIFKLMKETTENNNKQEHKEQEKDVPNNNKIIVFLADWCSHCQNFKPQLTEIMKTNKNIELVDSKDITPELQKHVQGFPTALRVSDETVAVGAPNILKLINSTSTDTNNTNNTKQENKSNYIFVYSDNCKYSKMAIPKWLELKVYAIDNKLNINLLEYESKELDKLPDYYKKQIVGFPTLFIDDKEKYEGYDNIINYLKSI